MDERIPVEHRPLPVGMWRFGVGERDPRPPAARMSGVGGNGLEVPPRRSFVPRLQPAVVEGRQGRDLVVRELRFHRRVRLGIGED